MKGISLIKLTLAIVVTALLSVFVSAEENIKINNTEPNLKAIEPVKFADLDLNNNGLLSEAEVAANKVLHELFAKVDINGDATINKDEYAAFMQSKNK